MELYYGAFKSKSVTSNLAKIKKIEETLEIIPLEWKRLKSLAGLKLNWRSAVLVRII